MTNRVYTAFITLLGVAITLASNQAFGGSGPGPGGSSVARHSPHHHRSPHHFNRRNIGTFFPGVGGFYGPFNGQPDINVTQTITDGYYTCTYDIPWDWVHRCPPSFFAGPPVPPSPPVAFRPGCSGQAVTVPGADGKDQTVNMLRC